MALGDQHDIRQAFIQNQIINFETFVGSCDMEFLQEIQLTMGNATSDARNKAKLKLVNDVILYYEFMYQDKEYAKVDDLTQWINRTSRFGKVKDIMSVLTPTMHPSLSIPTPTPVLPSSLQLQLQQQSNRSNRMILS